MLELDLPKGKNIPQKNPEVIDQTEQELDKLRQQMNPDIVLDQDLVIVDPKNPLKGVYPSKVDLGMQFEKNKFEFTLNKPSVTRASMNDAWVLNREPLKEFGMGIDKYPVITWQSSSAPREAINLVKIDAGNPLKGKLPGKCILSRVLLWSGKKVPSVVEIPNPTVIREDSESTDWELDRTQLRTEYKGWPIIEWKLNGK